MWYGDGPTVDHIQIECSMRVRFSVCIYQEMVNRRTTTIPHTKVAQILLPMPTMIRAQFLRSSGPAFYLYTTEEFLSRKISHYTYKCIHRINLTNQQIKRLEKKIKDDKG